MPEPMGHIYAVLILRIADLHTEIAIATCHECMHAEPGTLAWLNCGKCKPETNKAAKNARGREKSSSITVSSTTRGAAIEGDRGRIDVLLTELYNHEPGSYGCPARLLKRSYNLTVD